MYQHFKRLFAFTILFVLLTTQSLLAQTVTIGDYDVTFNGVTNNGDNTSTWSYTVSGIGEDPALSHWVLGLCDDHTVLSSNYSYEVNTDPTTGVYGIKWDKGIDPDESFTFTFTLEGIYDVVDVEAAVKAGQIKSYGDVPGPSCDSTGECENTIGDLIWHDSNVNGIQDDGEPGIEGVVVELYDNVGTLLFTTTTDNSGFYQFINIPNGTYVVILADQNFEAGGVLYSTDRVKWFATRPDQGSDDALDSDGHQYDYSVNVTLNCADDPTIDFGFFKACLTFEKTGPVSVNAGDVITYQFRVENCGDVVLHGGVQVFDPMINPNGDNKIWSKTVYPGEVYEFERSYITSIDDCGEVENTATAIGHPQYPDGTGLPNVVDEDTWTVDVICDDRASLGDRVWYDENENGIQDFGEDDVEGVTVNLYDCSDNPITSTTTDSDGYYLFDNLTPSDYYVEFILPAGYEFSPQNVGSDDTIDSDADQSTGKTICTTLAPYENDLTWDAGIYMPEDEHNDLTIEKTASNLNPDDEEVIFYTITVTNNGPSDATNVEVTDILQSGLNYQYSDPADYNPTTGIWSVGNIASGVSKSINIYVQVDYQSLSLTPSFDLGIAADYNLFVLKDVNQPSSDTQGKMAVGRNATLSYYSVGDQLPPSGGIEDVMIVGRNLIYTSGAVYGGNVVYGNSIDMPQYGVSVVDGTVRQENPVPIDFGQAQNDLIALSNELAGKTPNGTTTFLYGGLTLDGSDPIMNVFNVDGNDLSIANNFTINVPNGSVVLVNINRKTISWMGGLVVNGTAIGNVLYNFHKATSLTIQGIDIRGSVLAPKAKVNFVSGVINGQMICKFLEGMGQMNHVQFHGDIPGNPEIINCAEITNSDQPDTNPDNNVSCVTITVNVDFDPDIGGSGNWEEYGDFGLNEMIWTIYQSQTYGLLLGTVGGNIYQFVSGSWELFNEEMNVGFIWSMYETGGNIYCGTEQGLFMYNGSEWTNLFNYYADVRSITSIGGTLFAGVWGYGVFYSNDGGGTWQAMNTGLELTGFAVQTMTVANGELFAGTFSSGVFKFDFITGAWINLDIGYNFIWALAADETGNIYAGTSGAGVYCSEDGGDTWYQLNSGLPNLHIYSVTIYGSEVYVSTWIGGVYKLTTGTLAKGTNSVQDVGSWESLGMSGIEVSSIMVDEVEKTLYAGTSNGTIYKMSEGVTSADEDEVIPEKFNLSQNYPNPFNPSTTIEFSIPEAGLYSLKIYNILGQEVAALVNKDLNPGNYTVNFDASDLTSGMYLYKLVGEKVNITNKMVLLK